MSTKTPEDYLRLESPKTGRRRKEDATVYNEADAGYAESLLLPRSVVLRKQGYFFQDLRLSVAAANVYYYRLKAPIDKHLVIFVREITAGEGPVTFETVVTPTSFTPGTMITPTNLFTGGAASTAEVEKGVVPTGGATIPADYLFGAGNKSATASSGAALPTILPPGLEIFGKITNGTTGPNPGIRFALAYGEIDIPDIPVI